MKHIASWPESGRLPDDISIYFVCIDVKRLREFPDIHTIVQQKFTLTLRDFEETKFMRRLPYEISSCVTDVEKYHSCVEMDAINEAAVRVIYANAIVYIICTLNNYYFRMEQRLIVSDANFSPC